MIVKETRVMCYTPGCPDTCWPRFLSLSVVQEVPPPAWLFSPSLSVSVSRPAVVVALSPPTTPPAMGPKVKGQNSKGFTTKLTCKTDTELPNKPIFLITLNIFSSSNAAVPVYMTDFWQKRATFQQKQLVVVTNRWTALNRLLGRLVRLWLTIMYQFSCVCFTVFKLLLQTLHLLSAVSQPLLQFWDLTEHIHIIQINQPRSCDVWVNWRIAVLSPVRLSSLCKPWTNRLCAWPESADLWCWLSVERSGNKWEIGILSLIAVWNNTVWQH